jgi:hypothetical protein
MNKMQQLASIFRELADLTDSIAVDIQQHEDGIKTSKSNDPEIRQDFDDGNQLAIEHNIAKKVKVFEGLLMRSDDIIDDIKALPGHYNAARYRLDVFAQLGQIFNPYTELNKF